MHRCAMGCYLQIWIETLATRRAHGVMSSEISTKNCSGLQHTSLYASIWIRCNGGQSQTTYEAVSNLAGEMKRMNNGTEQDMFAIRPDHKGPKTLPSVILCSFSCSCCKSRPRSCKSRRGLNEFMAEILETPNQQGDNISFDAYQSYHKEVNQNNGYLIRGVSLVLVV